jgi:hypothetical protein
MSFVAVAGIESDGVAGRSVSGGATSLWQYRHFVASARMSSAQNGHLRILPSATACRSTAT